MKKNEPTAYAAQQRLKAAIEAVVRIHVPRLFVEFEQARARFFQAITTLGALGGALTNDELHRLEVAKGMYWSEGLRQPDTLENVNLWLEQLRTDNDALPPV